MGEYNSEIVAIINDILCEKFEQSREALLPEAKLKDDLHLDSLDFVDMFVLLEQKLGKTPQNIDFFQIKTLGDVYQLVTKLHKETIVK